MALAIPLAALLRNCDAQMRDHMTGRWRTRSGYYWRDMAQLLTDAGVTLTEPAEGLDVDGLPFCPTGYAQRYHAIGECSCITPTTERLRGAVVGYLMRSGLFRREDTAAVAADGLILTVRHPHLRWDLDWDHETEEHRVLRAALEGADR